MFSKEEAKRLRQEFWISFGKSFPRKWILYNTKIKDVHFKFFFDTTKARVSIDFEHPEVKSRTVYYNKFISLRVKMGSQIEGLVFSETFKLENEKQIASIYIERQGVSIHNKANWQEAIFLKEHMEKMEEIWIEFEDFIKS